MAKAIKQNEAVLEENPSRKEKIWEIIKAFVLPIAIVLFVRLYIVQPFIVKGASMEPNFEDREYLIIDEVTPVVSGLSRGTVIVFRYPLEPSEFFIKRVIGLPGEHISIKGGVVAIRARDGGTTSLAEKYLARGTVTAGELEADIPEDSYFVLGDNRNFSSDSRRWGMLRKDFLTGRVLVRLWPPEKIEIIKGAIY